MPGSKQSFSNPFSANRLRLKEASVLTGNHYPSIGQLMDELLNLDQLLTGSISYSLVLTSALQNSVVCVSWSSRPIAASYFEFACFSEALHAAAAATT